MGNEQHEHRTRSIYIELTQEVYGCALCLAHCVFYQFTSSRAFSWSLFMPF